MEVEEEKKYEISDFRLGAGQRSKVYYLKEKNSGESLVVKIFDGLNIPFYKNEKKILQILYEKFNSEENSFFNMFKDINYNSNLFKKPKEVQGDYFECLFFDYLSKFSLIDYINNTKEQIKEMHIQFLTYKLLIAIQNMHSLDICYNAINTSNIMFDNYFNPKLIHFSEAKIIDEKFQFNQDLFQLGKTLAKIFTLGTFHSINYNKKNNTYIIFGFAQDKKIQMEESKFWEYLKEIYKMNIPENFLIFFHILIKAKKTKELVDINDLLKSKWIYQISQDIAKFEKIFKKDFQNYMRI